MLRCVCLVKCLVIGRDRELKAKTKMTTTSTAKNMILGLAKQQLCTSASGFIAYLFAVVPNLTTTVFVSFYFL